MPLVVVVILRPLGVDPTGPLPVRVGGAGSSSGISSFDGPTAPRRTLSAIFVTTATSPSSSNTMDPTSPKEVDCAVTYDDGWLAGFTPVRFPVDAFFA